MYNCQLDELAKANLVCVERIGYCVKFMTGKEFAEIQAGIAWRALVNETVTIEGESFDYLAGCNVFNLVDYGNVEGTYLVTRAPWHVGLNHIPNILNRELGRFERGERSVFGARECAVMESVLAMQYDKNDKVFTITGEDGRFQFIVEKYGDLKLVN